MREAHLQGYSTYADKHAKQIFSRFLVLDSEDTHKSTYLRDLSENLLSLNRAVNASVLIPHTVKYRIYQSWDDVESYHVAGISTVQKELRDGDS